MHVPSTSFRSRQPKGTPLKLGGWLVLALQLMSPAAADDASNFRAAAGLSAYIGLLPAEIVRGHPKGHPEAEMHGGAPTGTHSYHLVVALFDEASGSRIENADVTATVSGLGHIGRSSIRLDAMSIEDTITYGNFVDLRARERFDIVLTIKTPDRADPTSLIFADEHLP